MKSVDEKLLRALSKEFSGGDNFDGNDVHHRWWDENFDLDEELLKHGFEPETHLESIIYALIKGHRPDLSEDDLEENFRVSHKALTGVSNRSRRRKDRYVLLKRVALAYHCADYAARMSGEDESKIELRKIVRPIVNSYFESRRSKGDPTGRQSLIEYLEDNFNNNREMLLLHATADYMDERFEIPEAVERVLSAFVESGMPVDRTAIKMRPIGSSD